MQNFDFELYVVEKIRLELHQQSQLAWGKSNPNPPVAAVYINQGLMFAGCSGPAGGPHAEVQAIHKSRAYFANNKAITPSITSTTAHAQAVSSVENKKQQPAVFKTGKFKKVLFVTLEPCCHTGKNPPCTDLIIDEEVECVFYIFSDPNPLVSGKGVLALTKAGITAHMLDDWQDNFAPYLSGFFHQVLYNKPRLWFKSASTLDGFTADSFGNSKWITSAPSRSFGHRLRSLCDGILVGANTVIKDAPRLLPSEERSTVELKEFHTHDALFSMIATESLPPRLGNRNLIRVLDLSRPEKINSSAFVNLFSTPDPIVITAPFGIEIGQFFELADLPDWEIWIMHSDQEAYHPAIANQPNHSRILHKLFDSTLSTKIVNSQKRLYYFSEPSTEQNSARWLAEVLVKLGIQNLLIEGGAHTTQKMMAIAEAGDLWWNFSAAMTVFSGLPIFGNFNTPESPSKMQIRPLPLGQAKKWARKGIALIAEDLLQYLTLERSS